MCAQIHRHLLRFRVLGFGLLQDGDVGVGLEMLVNTQQFDITGHPAMSLPCGLRRDLPVGMMLVGRHHAEAMIYRAAAAFESCGDWQKM